ncbi:MAG: DUF190 domain-containing protein [Candidatus Sumerlaeaceae bacterium]|nr:DUF190 domain-containing protein [Candidatus Sumerlaeaceae bacterium]
MGTKDGENTLLRIFLDKFQSHGHRPLYEVLLERARQSHFAGAMVLEGVEGFGQSGQFLKSSRWHLSSNVEVVLEMVGSRPQVESFVESIEPLLTDAIVTLERAWVHFARLGEKGPRP